MTGQTVDLTEEAEELFNDLDEEFIAESEITVEEVESYFQEFGKYLNDTDQMASSVVKRIRSDYGVDNPMGGSADGESELRDISEIEQTDGVWCTVKGVVADTYDNLPDNMHQKGRIEDQTGSITFEAWETNAEEAYEDGLETLEEGDSVEIVNGVTDMNQDDEGNKYYSLSVTPNTTVQRLDEEIELYKTVNAMIVGVAGDGYVVPDDDNDVEEETVEVRFTIDTGETTYQMYLNNSDQLEELTGYTLEDAASLAQESLDKEQIVNELRDEFVGRYVNLTGRVYSDAFFNPTDSEQDITPSEMYDIESLKSRGHALTVGGDEDE